MMSDEQKAKADFDGEEIDRMSRALVRYDLDQRDLEARLQASRERAELLRRDCLRAEARLKNAAQDATGELLWTYPDGQKCLRPYAEQRAAWIRTYAAYALPAVYEKAVDLASYREIARDAVILAKEVWETVQESLGQPNHAPTDEPTDE